MIFSDETLMAYVDHELGDDIAAAIEAAQAQDPSLAARIERHRRLRAAVHATYAPTLNEPPPERLLALARGGDGTAAASPGPASNVVDLTAARAARADAFLRGRPWRTWGALAASLVLGVWIGSALLGRPLAQRELFASTGGKLLAHDVLAHALDQQLASTQAAGAPVRIGVSFLARSGAYCRTFSLSDAALAGLACKLGPDWEVKVLAQGATAGVPADGYRMADSATPSAVSRSVDESIQGEPLDAAAERAAQLSGWRR
jgi:hypothetical protein